MGNSERVRNLGISAAILSTSVAFVGCENPKEPLPTYDGTLDRLIGHELMPDNRFNQLVKALKDSGSPLLTKLGRDAKSLRLSQDNPDEFTVNIDEATTPFITTQNPNSEEANTVISNSFEDTAGFKIAGQDTKWRFIEPLTIALEIINPPYLENADPLQEALVLAKEHLTAMLNIRVSKDFSTTGQAVFTDLMGNEITDPKILEKAGFSLVLAQESMDTTDIWRIMDALPTMIIATDLDQLIKNGIMPNTVTGITTAFYTTANFLNQNPDFKQKVETLKEKFLSSDNFTGPDGFTDNLFELEFVKKTLELNTLLYPKKHPIQTPSS